MLLYFGKGNNLNASVFVFSLLYQRLGYKSIFYVSTQKKTRRNFVLHILQIIYTILTADRQNYSTFISDTDLYQIQLLRSNKCRNYLDLQYLLSYAV